ncbi:MAG: hypothetical protein AB7F40_07685 [Victivallaceae bacterium]|nr:hypothetical protein [Victivallaceae bacterium]
MLEKLIASAAIAVATAGCCCDGACCPGQKCELPQKTDDGRAIVYAAYTGGEKIVEDGTFSQKIWETAPVYTLTRPTDWRSYYSKLTPDELAKYGDGAVLEPATFRMLYDDKNLYLGFQLTDLEVKADGKADQLAHFTLGDLVEIFIKPTFRDYYWEMYSTPLGYKTAYEFKGPRTGADGNDKLQLDFKVFSKVDGETGDGKPDKGWSTLVVIPRASLAKYGDQFTGDGSWTLLIGRYNYLSSDYAKEELSAFPQITKVDFHSLGEYAAIKFLPPCKK